MSVHWLHELTRMSNIDSIQVTRCNTQARGVLSGVHISYVVLSRSQTARLVNVRWKQRTINELCNFTEHLISGDETTCTSHRGEDVGGGVVCVVQWKVWRYGFPSPLRTLGKINDASMPNFLIFLYFDKHLLGCTAYRCYILVYFNLGIVVVLCVPVGWLSPPPTPDLCRGRDLARRIRGYAPTSLVTHVGLWWVSWVIGYRGQALQTYYYTWYQWWPSDYQ